jgi:cell division protein FtsL
MFMEEEKYGQNQNQNIYNMPLDDYQEDDNKRNSVNSIFQVKQSKISLFAKPLFSIVISALLSVALLLLFLHADGKYLDYTIIGLKIPTLVSLIMSVNLIYIASGLST